MPERDAKPNLPPTPEAARAVDLVVWPDPALRRRATPIDLDSAPAGVVRALGERMLEVMREHGGVGLAGPQVGVSARIFVMSATGEPGDDRVYVNPVLIDPDGEEEAEEGCLSLPEIRTPVLRSGSLRLRAVTPEGEPVDERAEGFPARVWQHEADHLDGVLILDKMPPSPKMACRKALRELEEEYAARNPEPDVAAKTRSGRRSAKGRKR